MDYIMKEKQKERNRIDYFLFALKKKKKKSEEDQMNTNLKNKIEYSCFVDVELEGTVISENVVSISAVKYSLSKEPTRLLSRDRDAADFELLVDALRKLAQVNINFSSCKEENYNMVSNSPESYTLNLIPDNFILVYLQSLNPDQQQQALKDLKSHLEQFHNAGFIVSFFDLQNYVAYDRSSNSYVLIGFPYLILDDDVLFRGIHVVPDYKYAARSQLVFKGPSKPSDYLALLKNFLVLTHLEEYNTICKENFQDKDLKLAVKENILLDKMNTEVSLSYTIRDCNCEVIQLYLNKCPHQSNKILFKLPEDVFKQLYEKCQELIEYEYEKVNEDKRCKGSYERTIKKLFKKAECTLREIKEYSGDETSVLDSKRKEIENIYSDIQNNSQNLPSEVGKKYIQEIGISFQNLQKYINEYSQILKDGKV